MNTTSTNPFAALAEVFAHKGEDMETIARDLAVALAEVMEEALGPESYESCLCAEFLRLRKLA